MGIGAPARNLPAHRGGNAGPVHLVQGHAVFILYSEGYWMLAEYSCDFLEVIPNVEVGSMGMLWLNKTYASREQEIRLR